MDGYKKLRAWQHASRLCLDTLEAVDYRWQPRSKAVLDHLSRAVVSADINIVEGYALGTVGLFRRHLRIAYGSAAEAERLIAISKLRGYLTPDIADGLLATASEALRTLHGLLNSRSLGVRRPT